MTTYAPVKRRTLVQYELRNLFGNWYIPFFGLVFPVLMAILISLTALRDVPEAFHPDAVTGVVLGFAQIIPMAGIFLGHSAIYSNELEDRIPVRMQLFGFSQRKIMAAKLQAQLVFQTLSLVVHFGVLYPVLGYQLPVLSSALVYFVILYLLGAIYFVFAHGIANFFRRFGPAYGVSMGLYFAFMILGGMMGVPTDMLPGPLRAISNLLPFTHMATQEFVGYWTGGPFNFAPLVQALIFLAALAVLVLVASMIYRRRRAY